MSNTNLILTLICIIEFGFILSLLYAIFKLYKSKNLNIVNRQINIPMPNPMFRYLDSTNSTIATNYIIDDGYKQDSSISYNEV